MPLSASPCDVLSQGLREDRDQRSEWQSILFRRLRGEFDQLDRSDKTAQAEDGLDIKPSAYWYVGRLEPDFSFVATLSRSQLDPDSSAAICPFDTGGLWHDHIATRDPLDAAGKRALYKSSVLAVGTYRNRMDGWMESSFAANDRYCWGDTPSSAYVSEIVLDRDSGPRNWTWELTLESRLPATHFPTATSLHMTQADSDNYMNWLSRLRIIDENELDDHIDAIEQILKVSSDPFADATARVTSPPP